MATQPWLSINAMHSATNWTMTDVFVLAPDCSMLKWNTELDKVKVQNVSFNLRLLAFIGRKTYRKRIPSHPTRWNIASEQHDFVSPDVFCCWIFRFFWGGFFGPSWEYHTHIYKIHRTDRTLNKLALKFQDLVKTTPALLQHHVQHR